MIRIVQKGETLRGYFILYVLIKVLLRCLYSTLIPKLFYKLTGFVESIVVDLECTVLYPE